MPGLCAYRDTTLAELVLQKWDTEHRCIFIHYPNSEGHDKEGVLYYSLFTKNRFSFIQQKDIFSLKLDCK